MNMPRYGFLMAGMLVNSAWAAPGIDAGSLLQQIERDRHLQIQPAESSNLRPLATPDDSRAQDGDIRFTVKKLIVLNVSVFDPQVLTQLLSDTLGQSVSLAQLRERIQRITAYYHTHGYPAAYAYLPEQTIADNGEVEVRVLEGYLGEIHLHNRSRLSDAAARARLPKMKAGEVLAQTKIERSAALENDIPGIAAQTAFNPGRDTGFTNIDVTLTDRPVLTTQLSVDNQGNRYTGDGNRIMLRPEISNFTGYGDKLTANLLYGGFGMKYHAFQYQLPSYWTGDGRAGIEYSEVDYYLGRELLASGSQGTTRSTGIFGSYPIVRGDALNVNVEMRHQEKMIRDIVQATKDTNERRSYSESLTLSGDWRDNAVNVWSVGYVTGSLALLNPPRIALDAASAQSMGHYHKSNWSYLRLQSLPWLEDATLSIALNGQINLGRNLDPSEKTVLGGARGVRAYPANEGMSDNALLATVEVKKPITSQLQALLFADYGKGMSSSYPWPAVASSNRRELGGAGTGVKYQLAESAYLSLQCAWRTTRSKPLSGNDTPNGRVWIEFAWGL